MLVVTMGSGVHGFTLDREIGAYTLTHPDMRIPPDTREFAIDSSNNASGNRRYGTTSRNASRVSDGERGEDFTMRWAASTVAEVHRILVRGGVFMYPFDASDPGNRAPAVYLRSQSDGADRRAGRRPGDDRARADARRRAGRIAPARPVILGSRHEVECCVDYHAKYDRGEDLAFETPFFKRVRSFAPSRVRVG